MLYLRQNAQWIQPGYFSYFHSLMSYGIHLFRSCTDINSIFVLKTRVIRTIYGLGSKVSKFKEINILTVTSQCIIGIFGNLIYVHKKESEFIKMTDVYSLKCLWSKTTH